ncbi:MAG: spermidine synthase [Desulforhopalus sp.]|jgi:spermidine synthase
MKNYNSTIIHKEFQDNNLIEIRDTATQRALFFNTQHLQSAMSFQDPQELILSYTRYMLLGLLINQYPKNILIIGLGSGSFVRFFHHFYPDSQIDGVDYSQHVIDIAKGYFQLPETENIQIICADGNDYVKRSCMERKYDLILVDAFDAQGMAPSIYTESFFNTVQEMLTEEGSISFNLWSSDKKLFGDIKKTLANTFTSSLLIPVPDRGNVIAVTMNQEIPWNKIDLPKKEIKALSDRLDLDFNQLVRVAKQNNGALKSILKSLFR